MRGAPLALLLPLLAAGCVGSALATAMETRHPADEAASLWSHDANLAGAVGIEGTGPLSTWTVALLTRTNPEEVRSRNDTHVGDGRAEAWLYRYVSDALDEAYVVVVDRDGNVRSARAEDRRDADTPLEGWTIDSDEALRLAADANPGIREGTDREKHGILSALGMEEGAPVWHVLAGGHDGSGGGRGYTKLHAGTGEILASLGGFAQSR